MSNVKRFSIRTLINRMSNPKPKPKPICLFYVRVSQLVKSHTGEESYIDTHNECSHLHKRITKKHCFNCPDYKPVIYNDYE